MITAAIHPPSAPLLGKDELDGSAAEGVTFRRVAAEERIVAAAGFHEVRQTEPLLPERFLDPYRRRFDDQFTQAAGAR